MWRRRDYTGTRDVIWYEEEEYKELGDKLAKAEKILYNIKEHLELDADPIYIIQKVEIEVERWKNMNVKSATGNIKEQPQGKVSQNSHVKSVGK